MVTVGETRDQQEWTLRAAHTWAQRVTLPPAVRQLLARAAGHTRALWQTPRVQRAQRSLVAHLPRRASERLTVLLIALWLLEAFLASEIIIAFIAWLQAPQYLFGATPGPGAAQLFMAIVVLPGCILATRWKQRQARDDEAQRVAPLLATDLERACWLLYVQPDAPLHIVQAAYVAAMKKEHPDVAGGDDSKARELNWAMETIRQQAKGAGDTWR